jgi:hypothetical protein
MSSSPYTITPHESESWVDGKELRVELNIEERTEILDVNGLFSLLSRLHESPDQEIECALFNCYHGLQDCLRSTEGVDYVIRRQMRASDFVWQYGAPQWWIDEDGTVRDEPIRFVNGKHEFRIELLEELASSILLILSGILAQRPQAKVHVGRWGDDLLPSLEEFRLVFERLGTAQRARPLT